MTAPLIPPALGSDPARPSPSEGIRTATNSAIADFPNFSSEKLKNEKNEAILSANQLCDRRVD